MTLGLIKNPFYLDKEAPEWLIILHLSQEPTGSNARASLVHFSVEDASPWWIKLLAYPEVCSIVILNPISLTNKVNHHRGIIQTITKGC